MPAGLARTGFGNNANQADASKLQSGQSLSLPEKALMRPTNGLNFQIRSLTSGLELRRQPENKPRKQVPLRMPRIPQTRHNAEEQFTLALIHDPQE